MKTSYSINISFVVSTFAIFFCSASSFADRAHVEAPPPEIDQITNPFDLIGRQDLGSFERLEMLLKKSGYPQHQDQFGRSLLTAAIYSSSKGAYTNPSDVTSGRDEVIRLILKYAPDICGKPGTTTPLHAAAAHGDTYWIYEILDRKCPIDVQNADGNTPLLEAIGTQSEAVRLLLSRGANPEIKNKLQQSPLELAALYYKKGEITSALLSYGANAKTSYEKALNDSKSNSEIKLKEITALLKDAVENKRPAKKPPEKKPLVPPQDDSDLIKAIKQGKSDEAIVLLKKGADANSLSQAFDRSRHDFKEAALYGTSALHLALLKKQYPLAKALIERGANVNLRGAATDFSDGNTPLALAVDNLEMVKFLIAHKADANRAAAAGETPIFYAQNPDVIRYLVSQGANVNYVTLSGTPLHVAIMNKQETKVALLLELGADPNTRDQFLSSPPLFKAIELGNEKVVKLLLSKGADPELKNGQNLNAYEFALHEKKENLALLLKKAKSGYSDPAHALSQAIHDKNVQWVESLLKEGVNANGNSQSPHLIEAAGIYDNSVVRFQIMKLLIEKGADVKVIDSNRRSLLHLIQDVEIAKLLIGRGLNVNVGNYEEQTPLHVSAQLGELEMVEFLLSHGAQAQAVDKNRQTPLHLAAEGPIDHRPADGPPPNWEKEGPRYIRIMELLLRAGANPHAQSVYNNKTPIDILNKCTNPDFKIKALAVLKK
jgi:cytohesin